MWIGKHQARGGRFSLHLALAVTALAALLGGAAFYFLLAADTEPAPAGASVDEFLEAHWRNPLPPQGDPPRRFPAREASTDARACGECHQAQYADWQTSQHSNTMNAGIRWQFYLFDQQDSNHCMQCHAPMTEQQALQALDREWEGAPDEPPPGFIPGDLHKQGLTCAACHVRGHERYGPPSRSGLDGDEWGLPHGGFQPHEAFSDPRFCANCHQFEEDGPRLNGKLRQDTNNEWRASPYAEAGITCQDCHMPDRRHLWRGITDPEMVRNALTVNLEVGQAAEGEKELTVDLTNTGAGHHVPTYMVPRIDVDVVLVGPDGASREEILHYPIQWRASLDLTEERYDQRIPAGESLTLRETIPETGEAGWRLRLEVYVTPKEHYERVYRDYLQRADRLHPESAALLRQALEEAEETRFTALVLERPLDEPGTTRHQGATLENWRERFGKEVTSGE